MELSNILDLFISAILTLVLNDFIVKNGPTNLSNQLIEVIEMDIYKDEESDLWEGSDEWWN